MPTPKFRVRRKPPWVARELVRIAAPSPDFGCRVIAEIFNQRLAERRIVVSKSFVALVMRRHHAEIVRARRTIKHRVPRSGPTNRTWAMDLTTKADLSGRQQLILGILDHGLGDVSQLAGGIGKALVCTATGMIVAIPALMFHRYFRGRIAGYIVDMEHEAIQLLDTLDTRPASARVAPGSHGITPPLAAS